MGPKKGINKVTIQNVSNTDIHILVPSDGGHIEKDSEAGRSDWLRYYQDYWR